jgi:hypothetical protein
MKKILFFVLSCVACAAQAQMYRWVDEKGSVHYSDQPPPPNAKKVEEKKFSDNVVETDKLPYAVQQAVKNFPVILYTGDCGQACTLGKAYLVKRGIPFSERLPGKNQADLEQMKKVSKETLIPLLLVGKSISLKGFNEAAWASALDQAGYPKTNPLAPGQQAKPSEAGKTPEPAKPAAKPADSGAANPY